MAALTVGQVAKRVGIAVSAVHFYEQKGLITSSRNQGNQRRYQSDTLRRLALIKAAQQLGLSLQEIKKALDTLPNQKTPDTQDWQQLSSQWHASLTKRINALEALRDSLTSCIGCGCLSLKHCPLYNPDDTLASQGTGGVLLTKSAVKS